MSVIYIVLPLALVVVLAAVIAFYWAAKRGQFDDLETPAIRALHDDEAMGAGGEPAPRDAEHNRVAAKPARAAINSERSGPGPS